MRGPFGVAVECITKLQQLPMRDNTLAILMMELIEPVRIISPPGV